MSDGSDEPGAAVAPLPADRIERLAVIGAGMLGWQIACVCLHRGFTVVLHDIAEAALTAARVNIADQLGAMTGGDDAVAAGALDRLVVTTDLAEAARDTDFVIEAAPESLPLKRELFAALDAIAPPPVILATNSSSIRSRLLADATTRPDRVLNLHFLNRPWQRPYVEVMTCGQTSATSLTTAAGLGRRLGLHTVVVQGEVTGFVFNRVWRAIKRECLAQLARGAASVEDLDAACVIGLGMPEGPFRMMDRVGLDVVLAIEDQCHAETGDPADAPPAFLREMVAAGRLGRKSSRGFYDYT